MLGIGKAQEKRSLYDSLARQIDAGISLSEALALEGDFAGDNLPGQVITPLVETVQGGRSLAEAMAGLDYFSTFEVKVVEVGEKSGRLFESLQYLARWWEEKIQLKKELLAQLAYPVFLLHAALLIPNIPLIMKGIEAYLIATGKLVLAVYLPVGLGYFLYHLVARHPSLHQKLSSLFLSLPLVGKMIQKKNMAEFLRAFQALYQAGVPAIQAFEEGAKLISNPLMRKKLSQSGANLSRGADLEEVLLNLPYLPRQIAAELRSGVRSGNLDSVLELAVSRLDEEHRRQLGWMAKIGPVFLYLAVAAYIAYRVISFYAGLYSNLPGLR